VDEYTSRFWVDEEHSPRRTRRIRIREQHHKRAERNMVLLTLLGIAAVTALVIAAWNYGAGAGKTDQAIPNLPSATAQRPKGNLATLVVRAQNGASLVEVRKWSAKGDVLFHGTLERDETQRFVAKRLWLNVSSPENLFVTLNGEPASLGAGCPQVVMVTPKQVTSTATCG
jgi:hypothetical protein